MLENYLFIYLFLKLIIFFFSSSKSFDQNKCIILSFIYGNGHSEVINLNFYHFYWKCITFAPLWLLQVASCTLDASAKIYGYRVDSVHTDTLKMAGGLGSSKGEKGKEAREEMDHQDDNEERKEKKKKVSPGLVLSAVYHMNMIMFGN